MSHRIEGAAVAQLLIATGIHEPNRLAEKLQKLAKKAPPKAGEVSVKSGAHLKRQPHPVFVRRYAAGTLMRAQGPLVEVRVELPFRLPCPGEVWGFAHELVDVLVAPAETIDYGDDGKLSFDGTPVPVIPVQANQQQKWYPHAPPGTTGVRLDEAHRGILLDLVEWTAAPGDRDFLQGVWLDPESNNAWASDGRRLRRCSFECGDLTAPMMVPRALIKVLKADSIMPHWIAAWDDDYRTIVGIIGENFQIAEAVPGKMPAFHKIGTTPDAVRLDIALNPVLTELRRWKRLKTIRVGLEMLTDGSLRLHLVVNSVDCAGRILLEGAVLNPPHETKWAWLDQALLSSSLEALDGDRFTVAVWTEVEKGDQVAYCMLVTETETATTMLMGMKGEPEEPYIWTKRFVPSPTPEDEVECPPDSTEDEVECPPDSTEDDDAPAAGVPENQTSFLGAD